ncbi:PAS domain S-box-containing protein [Archangium gephyra]|uniref:histidine kinase n=1 Tax=Archangium gephyra TaxID=48 RepID=A0AAC8TFF3_9BACT|nr:ATP-binding protein [Archangium gephyra]AKJ04052.1 Chemotaxis protein methyltransferase CheR [Archangium gephyra]REG37865.1 PAS domain S-box-containing protein [Archangium gephyra]
MSSTSTIQAGQAVAQTARPHGQGRWNQRLGGWILSRLDVFLSKPLRRAAPEEVVRCRLLVCIALGLMLLDMVLLLSLPVSPQPLMHATIGLFSLSMNTAALVLLRRRSSHELSALIVCSTIAATFVFTCITSTRPFSASHAASMLLPAMSVYLMGARLGFILTVPVALFVGLIHPVHFLARSSEPIHAGNLWIVDVCAAICMMVIWAVSWLHTAARNQAHAAREQALRTVRESERKLHSLIEHTDDQACSVDVEGRLIIANSAMRRAYRERYGFEPVPGEPFLARAPPEHQQGFQQLLAKALSGQGVRHEDTFVRGDRTQVTDISYNPVFGEDGRPLGVNLFGRDITERKESELKLSEMHRSLLDVSRHAGMAEVATGLLHNVGNTLNSVNVSANLVTERLRGLRVSGLVRSAELLREHSEDLCTFLATDPRGRQLPAYLIALADQLTEEQQALLDEQRTLTEGLEHVKSIVSMQQEHARFAGMVELMSVTRLIDDALRLQSVSFSRHGIEVHREYTDVPPILLDRHKLLQIILNLLSNARHAVIDSGRPDKRITIRVAPAPEDRLRIQVSDNGLGIPAENLGRLFSQGFTTRKNGHGFGLHISALSAIEMAGSLTCESEGEGRGATFTVELPMQSEDPRL